MQKFDHHIKGQTSFLLDVKNCSLIDMVFANSTECAKYCAIESTFVLLPFVNLSRALKVKFLFLKS